MWGAGWYFIFEMSLILYSTAPKIPASDNVWPSLRARLGRYLEGPLPSLASGLQESARLQVVDTGVPDSCAWWRMDTDAWVGMPASTLDFLAIFHQRPDLPSGPDDFWARLAADRPLAFSRAHACVADAVKPAISLSCLVTSSDWHMLFFYSPSSAMCGRTFPGTSRTPDFSFECALSAGFLPMESLRGAGRGDVLHAGWPAKNSLWMGRHDMWLPLRFSGGDWRVAGGWFMKPSPSDHFPLEISVELGRIRLRGRDLDSLVPGAILPMGVSAGGEVLLVSDGRVLARGELVVAGGELAVRVLSDVMLDPPRAERFPS